MSLFSLRPEVGEALWLLGAVRVVTAAAEAKRQKKLSAPQRARRRVVRLGRQLDRLQLALLYAQGMSDQTMEAAVVHHFDLLLSIREVADSWWQLHQDLLGVYPGVSAGLIEAVRQAAQRMARLSAEAPWTQVQRLLLQAQKLRCRVHRALQQMG